MNKKSNLELMRIISMFFIVLYHIIIHSGLMDESIGGSKFLLVLLESFLIIHVNSFILLTGYFQSDKKAKLSKVISIINANWFYKLLCFIGIILLTRYFSFSNSIDLTFHQKIISILPLDRGENWYVNCYLLLYIFSPFLNLIIDKLDRKKFKKLILLLFVVFSVVGTIVIGKVIPNYEGGRCLFTFILLYFVGAYLKKYPIEESRIFNVYTNKMKKHIFLVSYIILSVVIAIFKLTSVNIPEYGKIFSELSTIFLSLSDSFLSPLIIISSISYFLFFKNMNFNSKLINFIGGTTFGIYLLHENIYIRDNLYRWLNVSKYSNCGIKMIGIAIALAIVMFISCMIIEIIRKGIFKFFYKRKFAEKLRNKNIKLIESLGLDINY